MRKRQTKTLLQDELLHETREKCVNIVYGFMLAISKYSSTHALDGVVVIDRLQRGISKTFLLQQ